MHQHVADNDAKWKMAQLGGMLLLCASFYLQFSTTVYKAQLFYCDQGFPESGANHKGGGANLLFWPLFPENCMKLKKMGPRERRMYLAPPAP